MVGAGMLMALIAAIGLVMMARRNVADKRWFLKLALLGAILPIVGNWIGLDLHRGRPPAVGRLRPVEDLAGPLDERVLDSTS